MIKEISLLFILYVVVTLSIYGWGQFTSRCLGLQIKPENSGQTFFIGISTVLLLTQILHIFFPIDWKISSTVFFTGILFLCKFTKIKINEKFNQIFLSIKIYPFIGISIAVLILGYSTRLMEPIGHGDAGLYHVPTINWLNQYSIVPGLGNLHFRLAFNQSYFHLAALLNFSPLWDHGYQSTNFLLFIATVFSTYQLINTISDYKYSISLLLLLIFIVILQDSISPAPDFTICLYEFNIFLLVFKLSINTNNCKSQNLRDIIYLIILCTTCITIKLSSIVFCTFCVLIIFIYYFSFIKTNYIFLLKPFIFCISILFISVLTGFILSGYLFYPSTFTGGLYSEWAIPVANVVKELEWIFSWARDPSLLPQEVLGNWNWLSPWVSNLSAKVWLPLGLGTLVILISFFSCKFKINNYHANRKLFILYLPLLLSLIFWFFTAPDPRFIGAIPGLFLFLSCFILYLNFDYKKYLASPLTKVILATFCILFLILCIMYTLGLGTGFGIIKLLHISAILTATSEVGINQKLTLVILFIVTYIFLLKYFRIKAAVFQKVLSFIFCSLILVSLFNYMNVQPSLSLNWAINPEVETKNYSTRYGLELNIPDINDRCWSTRLPCTPYVNANLNLSKIALFNGHFFKYGFTTIPQK